MDLLLDTNVILWLATGSARLNPNVIEMVTHEANAMFVSVISGWEYEQKRLKHPAQLPIAFGELVAAFPHGPLDFPFEAFPHAGSLPMIHRDPFDRMLVAQALHYDLTIVTPDEAIRAYPAKTFW